MNREQLERTQKHVEALRLQTRMIQLQDERRDVMIEAARRDRVPVRLIAEATGLTRGRVYQILQERTVTS